jgi:hypothetical protein
VVHELSHHVAGGGRQWQREERAHIFAVKSFAATRK